MTTVICPVCNRTMQTRAVGNHLRQKHGVPIPARKRDAVGWATQWLATNRPAGTWPEPAKPKAKAKKTKTVAPANLPSADEVTAAIVKSLFDGNVPVGMLTAVFDLHQSVSRFLFAAERAS